VESVICPECGAENPADAEACMACGADIAAASGPLAKIPASALLGGVVLILLVVFGVLAKTCLLYTSPSPRD